MSQSAPMPARTYQITYCDRFAGSHAAASPYPCACRASGRVAKTPRLLTTEQRDAFVRIPPNLSERDLGRFYTLSARDLEIIGRHRRPANPLGFAVHPVRLLIGAAIRYMIDVAPLRERVILRLLDETGARLHEVLA